MRALILPVLLLVTLSAFAAAPLTFEEVDTDGDGLISADEAANVEGLDFNAADGDNDGTLSVDEYEIAMEKLSPPAETAAATTVGPAVSTTPAPPATDVAKPNAPVTPASPPTKIDAPKPAESTLSVKPAAPPAPPKP
ncbi:MAG: hypothetical protein P9F75_09365 [Candidatus Contendobacter sp.]|nr:hypothetical protein [Candidatus Contendobacter sp.]MDS4031872.1 hypothetical protein [Candidatus Contendobacter sp.]MDS4059308.1 hypothetical protein [Candidatus Contendobacter sp.]